MAVDERQPLLRTTENEEEELKDVDLPEHWSKLYRWGVTALLAFMAFTVTFTCISVVPIADNIIASLQERGSSRSSSVLLVTIWELGEAAGPLLIAPLSEIYGRYPVFNAANALFICGVLMSVLSQSVDLLIFARFLTGCAVASNVLGPAVIGDIFPSESRGSAMSVVMVAPLLGGAVGPLIAGAIAESAGWRMVMWMAVILAVVCEILFLTLFRETYKPVIVKRNTKTTAEVSSEDASLRAPASASRKSPLWIAITRPATVFSGSFVLQILSLFGAVSFSFFYIMSTTLPDILRTRYGFTPSQIGISFMTFSLGSFLSILVTNAALDRIYTRLQPPSPSPKRPEARLPLPIFSALCLPLAVLLYGFSASFTLHPAVLLSSVVLQGFVLILGMVGLMSYVVDSFGEFSASAMTAVLITRCLCGTFLPLVTEPLVAEIGWGLGFVVLAAICVVVAPVPIMVYVWGGKWRQWSSYTKDD